MKLKIPPPQFNAKIEKPNFVASIIADSLAPTGKRLTTFLIQDFPLALAGHLSSHTELSVSYLEPMTLQEVEDRLARSPYIPAPAINTALNAKRAREIAVDTQKHWKKVMQDSLQQARTGIDTGLPVKTCLEPLKTFLTVDITLSATSWANVLNSRFNHPNETYAHAVSVLSYMLRKSAPRLLSWGSWHAPYASHNEVLRHEQVIAWCYAGHRKTELQDELEIFNMLIRTGSYGYMEHLATVRQGRYLNFNDFQSYRSRLGA